MTLHPAAAAATMVSTADLTQTQAAWSMTGITLGLLALATTLRMRAPNAATALARRGPLSRLRFMATLVKHLRTALAWAAFALFALAGVAATATIVRPVVLWCTDHVEAVFAWTVRQVAGHSEGAQQATAIAAGLLVALIFFKGVHFLFDLLEGKAHLGGADGLVFLGPVLFPLVPGWFGMGAAHVYGWLGAHLDTIAAHVL